MLTSVSSPPRSGWAGRGPAGWRAATPGRACRHPGSRRRARRARRGIRRDRAALRPVRQRAARRL